MRNCFSMILAMCVVLSMIMLPVVGLSANSPIEGVDAAHADGVTTHHAAGGIHEAVLWGHELAGGGVLAEHVGVPRDADDHRAFWLRSELFQSPSWPRPPGW